MLVPFDASQSTPGTLKTLDLHINRHELWIAVARIPVNLTFNF
jgi:hypothetical protein